jgi:Ca-activated chloride channel family protein
MKIFLIISFFAIVSQLQAQTVNESIIKGNELYRQGKFEEAEKQYNEAVKKEPENKKAKFNLAATIYKMGKEGEAMKAYDEIATTEKDLDVKAKAWYNKGAILSKQKRLEESIEAYKNALRNNPDDKQARENLQKALLELKKKEPPKKKEEDKKKKKQEQQQQKQKQQPKLNQKEAEQRLKLLQQKEKELQERLQKEKSKGGGSQTKDW